MNQYMKNILAILCSLSLLWSCSREEPTTWNIHGAGPIAHGRLSLNDMVADSLLSSDEAGLWHLVFTDNLTDFNLDSVIAIPDTTIHRSFVVPLIGGPFSIPPNSTIIGLDDQNVLNIPQVELKEVLSKGGTLQYTVKNYVNGYLTCTYTLPGITKDGQPAVLVASTFPGNSDDPSFSTGSLDLTGYHIDLTGENGTSTNTILSEVNIKTSPDAPSNAEVYGQDSVVIDLQIVEPLISYARGYFGQHHYELDEEVSFGDDIDLPTGVLNLSQISVDFKVENNVGVDARIEFSGLTAENTLTSSSVALVNSTFFSDMNITRATDVNGMVIPTYHEVSLTETNSNVDAFIETLPDAISVQANVDINPLGNVSDNNDFIYTDKPLNALMEVDIPLCIGMSNLTLEREIDLGEESDIPSANGIIYLKMINGFPLSALVDLTMVTPEGTVISGLLANAYLAPAPGDGTSDQGTAESVFAISVNDGWLSQWGTPNKLLLSVSFNTDEATEWVKLTTSGFIDFVISGDITTEVSVR